MLVCFFSVSLDDSNSINFQKDFLMNIISLDKEMFHIPHGAELPLGAEVCTARALVIQNDQVLLLKRKQSDSFGGLWEFPGGCLEHGETVHQALHREVREETGLHISDIVRFVHCLEFRSPLSGRTIREFVFEIKTHDAIALLLSEHDESVWVHLDQINAYKLSPVTQLSHQHILHGRAQSR